MKPPPFLYVRPETVDGVVEQLAASDGQAKVLAGGQSLVPLLNLRMAAPGTLVDITRVPELSGIAEVGGHVRIGAATRQREAELSATVGEKVPLLRQALRHVAHLQIRTRGTVGGSLAHADPAAELPAVAMALDAELSVAGPSGSRSVPAADFFEGFFTTALAPEEVLTAVSFPVRANARTTFIEFARRTGDFAIAGLAAVVMLSPSGNLSEVRLVGCGVGPGPQRLVRAEAALRGRAVSEEVLRDAANVAGEEVEPFTDVHADASYRKRLIGAIVVRAIREVTR